MNNTKFITDYIYLAEAGYADFSDKNISDKNAIINKGKPEQFAELASAGRVSP